MKKVRFILIGALLGVSVSSCTTQAEPSKESVVVVAIIVFVVALLVVLSQTILKDDDVVR
jgi:uncharacterized membrane protein YfcA